MTRRGRPPHPDILTPRQRQVLDLIRAGRTDQQIADQLGVSLDGAKYHVSEILSKLGVSSREEAAAWREEERTIAWWQRAFGPVAVRWVAAGMTLAAIVAVAALAGGVWLTGTGGEASIKEEMPLTQITREQAILRAGDNIPGEVIEVDAIVGSAEVLDSELVSRGYQSGIPQAWMPSGLTWLVTFRGYFSSGLGESGERPALRCSETSTLLPDAVPSSSDTPLRSSLTTFLESDACDFPPEPSADLVMLFAADAAGAYLGKDPSVDVQRLPVDEVSQRVAEYGFALETPGWPPGRNPGTIWLVTFTGPGYASSSPTQVPGAFPNPSPTARSSPAAATNAPTCRTVIVALEGQGPVLLTASVPSDTCAS